MYNSMMHDSVEYRWTGRQHLKKYIVRILFLTAISSLIIAFAAIVHVYADGQARQQAPERTNAEAYLQAEFNHGNTSKWVEVDKGDTLWSIASARKPNGVDIRTYVRHIQAANDLHNGMLKVGELLAMPAK